MSAIRYSSPTHTDIRILGIKLCDGMRNRKKKTFKCWHYWEGMTRTRQELSWGRLVSPRVL